MEESGDTPTHTYIHMYTSTSFGFKKKRLFTTHFCIIDYTMGLYPEVCELVQKKNKAHCGRCGVSEEVVNETSTVRGLAWRDG